MRRPNPLRSARLTGGLLAIVCVASACGGTNFDRDGLVSDVVATYEVEAEIADCVVQSLVDEFGESTLAQDRRPTVAEVETVEASLPLCELREQVIASIVETSGDRDVAVCIYDTAVAEFGVETIVGGAADDAQTQRLGEITEACGRA